MSEINLIPAGNYKAVAVPVDVDGAQTYVQFGTTKGKDGGQGKKQVLVTFEILEGPMQGRRVPWWGYFTDSTWKRTIESLRYCGFKGDDLFQAMAQELDQQVSITVEHNEWEGKRSARVAWVNKDGGGIKLASPMATDDLRRFAAAMKSRTSQVVAVEGKKAERGGTPAPAPEPPSTPSDDLPF